LPSNNTGQATMAGGIAPPHIVPGTCGFCGTTLDRSPGAVFCHYCGRRANGQSVDSQQLPPRSRITCAGDGVAITGPHFRCRVCHSTFCDRCADIMTKNARRCIICGTYFDGNDGDVLQKQTRCT
jgi:hypothetical protein